MSSYSFRVPGAVLDARVVTQLGEILRPYSLPYYEFQLTHPANPEHQSAVTHILASGGSMQMTRWSITQTSGVVHDDVGQNFPLDLLKDFVRVSFVFAPHNFADTTHVAIDADEWGISATIKAEADKIDSLIQDVRSLLDSAIDQDKVRALLPPFTVFVGHGGDRKWEVVRDYISDAGYAIECFEADTRAGNMTLDVVMQMLSRSTVAVVVMTGVEKLRDGRILARQNVVHEIGLAQGLLGVENTIVLLEDGTEEFTNISGLTEVRFPKGEIHITRSEVLTTLANHARRRGQQQDPPTAREYGQRVGGSSR